MDTGREVSTHKTKKKDLYRRTGKGRRCFLGDKTASIPCRASYFEPGRFEEEADLCQDDLKNKVQRRPLPSFLYTVSPSSMTQQTFQI